MHVLCKNQSGATETNIITSYKWSLQDWPKNLRITNQTEEEMLDDQEDDGRTVFEMEWGNKSLP
jgi:hypothetical protein